MPHLFWKCSQGTASKFLLIVDMKLCLLHCSDGRQEGHMGRHLNGVEQGTQGIARVRSSEEKGSWDGGFATVFQSAVKPRLSTYPDQETKILT